VLFLLIIGYGNIVSQNIFPDTLVFGAGHNFPPYAFIDENGTPQGFSIDLINAVAKEMDLEIKIKIGNRNDIINEFEKEGTIHIVDMFYSPDRETYLDFSITLNIIYDEIFVREENLGIKRLDDIAGKKVIIKANAFAEEYIKENNLDVELVFVETESDALIELSNGIGDVAIVSHRIALGFLKNPELTNIYSLEMPELPREYCFAVTHENHHLIRVIDVGIIRLMESGEYAQLEAKWFGNKFENLINKYWINAVLILIILGLIIIIIIYGLQRLVKIKTNELKFSENRLKLISKILGSQINKVSPKEQALALLDNVKETFETDAAIIRILEGENLKHYVSVGINSENIVESISADIGFGRDIINTREVLKVINVDSYNPHGVVSEQYPSVHIFKSYLGAPLIVDNQIIGIIGLYMENAIRDFSQLDVEHLLIVANKLAILIKNVQLFDENEKHKDVLVKQIKSLKETKEILKASEERYRRLFEDSPISLWEEDFTEISHYLDKLKKDGVRDFREFFDKNPHEVANCSKKIKILDVNKATLEFNEAKSKKELLGNLDKTFTQKSFEIFKEELIVLAKGGSYFHSEAEVKTITGKIRAIDLRFFVNYENQVENKSTALIVISDITERKDFEETINKANLIINRSPMVAFLWKNEKGWPVEYVSKGVEKLFGYSTKEFLSQDVSYSDIIFEEDRDIVTQEVLKISNNKNIVSFSHKPYRIVTKENEVKWVEDKTYIRRNSKGNVTHYEGIVFDITEQKVAQESLAKVENQLISVMYNIADGFVMFDSEMNYTYLNPKGAESLGFKASELIGKNYWELFPEAKGTPFANAYEEVLRTKSPVIIENYYEPWDKWFENRIYPNDDGLAIYFSETTQRKKIEHQLENYRNHLEKEVADRTEQLAASNKELKDFAYVVSHDLKAPLRAISQLSFWLLNDYKDKLDEDGKENLSLLVGRVKRLDALIDGILQYSRVGKAREKEENIDFNILVSDIITSLESNDSINIEVENTLPTYIGDSNRFTQVFQNLISNSIKFMDKPLGKIKIGCEENEKFYKLWVKDNGIGIEEKYFDRVFQIFQTLQPRDQTEGTGVGLTLVKKIVNIYKGKVWIESKLGVGTEVYFTLPKKSIKTDS